MTDDPETAAFRARPPEDRHSRAVPILLAVAAVLAAIVTARATLLASDASVLWVRSVGEEQRRGVMLQESIRYTYGTEASVGFGLLGYEVRAEELRAAASAQPEAIAAGLRAEADRDQTVHDLLGPNSPLVSDPRYRRPSGALDLEQRLADDRALNPDTLAIDPMATLDAGDEIAERSDRLLQATIIIATAFLFGSLAQALGSRRRLLLALGWVVLLAGAGLALSIELGIGVAAA